MSTQPPKTYFDTYEDSVTVHIKVKRSEIGAKMSPKPKPTPHCLGPPPQLLAMKIPMVKQKLASKVQPKLMEVVSRHVKVLAKWFHTQFSWKKLLMSSMVVLIASKMMLLMLTYDYFTLTSLVSLQIFHGVWTIVFFCLTIIDTKTILPNASCLLAGYLPATTVLHILLFPIEYPLEYIITDAVTTLLAIVTMFLLLRMECSQILHEAEELWQHQPNQAQSETGTSSTGLSSQRCSPRMQHHVIPPIETVSSPQYQVNYPSMDNREINNNNLGYEEAIDLEPIDFEHFIDEPELGRPHMERRFRQDT